jgi:hypothetical protein
MYWEFVSLSSGYLCAEREELWGQRPGVRDRAVYLFGTTMPTVGSIDESAGRMPETE